MRNLVCALALLAAAPAAAEDWKFSSSVNYDTGKYGGTTRVDTVYIPFTLKRYFLNTDLSATLPYLRQSSTGQITRVGGKPARAAAGAASSGGSAEGGLGDILLRGTYLVKRDGPGSFDFSLGGRIKLPTADEKKGLGTGEMDQGAGFEFGKALNERWTLLAEGYYTIIGDPAGADYNNQLALSLGFYKPLRRDLGLTVLYETSSALLDGGADPRTLSAALVKGGSGGLEYTVSLALGLSEGSPQYGLGAGFGRKF
ncbi:MAG: transporter [Elusimicrobiales bacterium]|nr:transporter [Elusimicrobiales bacterium]